MLIVSTRPDGLKVHDCDFVALQDCDTGPAITIVRFHAFWSQIRFLTAHTVT